MMPSFIAEIRRQYNNEYSTKRIREASEIFRVKTETKDEYPFPVVKTLKNIGFVLARGEFKEKEKSGIITVDSSMIAEWPKFNSDKVLFVNGIEHISHQRFTIGYLIACYIFDYDEEREATYSQDFYFESRSNTEEEKRAERFAIELLLPHRLFTQKYNEYIKDKRKEMFSVPSTITYLAKLFDTPAKIVRDRLVELECRNPATGEKFAFIDRG